MKIAIIGAGACGLTAIKCCRDEGLEPVCFEQENNIGGLWYFTGEDRPNVSSVYRTTVINTSKEMMYFSDFPIPKEFPPFMHNKYVMQYFQLYADKFDLYKHIRFQTKVLDIKPAQDYEDTGKWELQYCRCDEPFGGDVKREVFDGVLVCTGHHWMTSWPTFPGMNNFSGVQMHSHSYKDHKPFEGKTVLVVGVGNSGGDISVELSRHASKVYLSTRRGAWVLSRLHKGGVPIDQYGNCRFLQMLPMKAREYLTMKAVNTRFNHANFGLQPEHSILGQHPMVNDDLPHRIVTGALTVKPNVSHFTKTGVVFEDDTKEDNLDAVIFCTGYKIGFGFIDQSVISVDANGVLLYKYVFPPQLSKPTLAVIGCVQPLGAINPLAELQARWAARVFKGDTKLPSESNMMKDIKMKKAEMSKRYYAAQRHTIQVDYIAYADELAELVGCRPNFVKLFFQDPSLAFKCFFGPCVPAQYRLMGPGTWEGAKKAIEQAPHNVIFATKTRAVAKKKPDGTSVSFAIKMFVLLAVVLAVVLKYFM